MKLEPATHRGEFNGSSTLRIANQSIRNAEGQMIHRPGRWHANVPISDAAWIVLNRRLRPAFKNLDGASSERKGPEERGRNLARYKLRSLGYFTEIAQVCLGTVDGSGCERRIELLERLLPVFSMHDDLCDHRIIEGGDGCPRLNPCFNAGELGSREIDQRQFAGSRLKVLGRVLSVYPGFN